MSVILTLRVTVLPSRKSVFSLRTPRLITVSVSNPIISPRMTRKSARPAYADKQAGNDTKINAKAKDLLNLYNLSRSYFFKAQAQRWHLDQWAERFPSSLRKLARFQ